MVKMRAVHRGYRLVTARQNPYATHPGIRVGDLFIAEHSEFDRQYRKVKRFGGYVRLQNPGGATSRLVVEAAKADTVADALDKRKAQP